MQHERGEIELNVSLGREFGKIFFGEKSHGTRRRRMSPLDACGPIFSIRLERIVSYACELKFSRSRLFKGGLKVSCGPLIISAVRDRRPAGTPGLFARTVC